MKLLALVTEAYGGFGGIAQYNKDLLDAIRELPELKEIIVIPRKGHGESLREGRVYQIRQRSGRIAFILESIFRAFLTKPDVIFCGHIFMLPLAVSLALLFRKPVWLQIHGIEAWRQPSRLHLKLIPFVKLVFSVSRYTRQRFLGWASISPELVKVIPNTVSERYVPVARNTARIQFGIDKHKVILTVGRLSAAEAYKGHDRILRCLKILRDRHPNLLYIIAGDGDDRARLESLAGILGVSEMVRFLGKVDDNQLAQLYSAADLFAMPSTGEGFGIVFLESMACGTPALGLDQDGSRDPLRDGLLGYISPPDGLCSTLDIALGSERPSKLADDTIHYFGVGTFRSSVARYLRAWPSWRNSGVN